MKGGAEGKVSYEKQGQEMTTVHTLSGFKGQK